MTARKLATIAVEKPWGRTSLPAPFDTRGDGARIGEIWFEPPAGSPLLAKYIFTGERLSIQVHPDDAEAQARGLPAGKEEWWYVLAAEPEAVLGIGTVRPLTSEELADAARTGEIEDLMQWHPVTAGMTIHVPPGTVHAIGAGLSLIEIQQNSDVTYRLYDYGRPRELHLADGAAVSVAEPFPPAALRTLDAAASQLAVEGTHFSIARIAGSDVAPVEGARGQGLLLPLDDAVDIGDIIAEPGECLWIEDVAGLTAHGGSFLVAWSRG